MSEETKIKVQWGFDIITDHTPEMPEAKRGAVHIGSVQETGEQLENDLVWVRCSFCARRVLVLCYGTGEICACGAKRFNRRTGEGWKKDGVEWFFI